MSGPELDESAIEHARPHPRPANSLLAFAGVVLVVLGLGLWALYRFVEGDSHHAYGGDGVAPTYVHVTAGDTYSIAVPDGIRVETRLGYSPTTLRCTINQPGTAATRLAISAEPDGSKATDQIAGFTAPYTGRVHVDCPGLPAVFVDDADGSGTDVSGLLLLLATIALTIGAPLTLAALRGAPRPEIPADA